MRALPRQTLIDIALVSSGSAEAAAKIAVDNGLSLSDDVQTGCEIRTIPATRSKVTAFFATTPPPATAIDASSGTPTAPGGINYMGIEIDFKVS